MSVKILALLLFCETLLKKNALTPKTKHLTPIEEHIVGQVKRKRQEKNMSQAELAFQLGVSPGFIGNVESGNYGKKYNLNHINRLARIFECSPKDFLPENYLPES